MKFPSRQLHAMPGVLYGQVLEDRSAGKALDVYWAVSVPFEPLDFVAEEVRPLLQCSGLSWPLARWQELEGKTLAKVKNAQWVEASFYVYDHSDLELEILEISARKRGVGLQAYLRGRVDFQADDGSIQPFPIELDVPLTFEGIRIVPGNLRSGPRTPEEASRLLGRYLEPEDYLEPEWDGVCFLYRPRQTAGDA